MTANVLYLKTKCLKNKNAKLNDIFKTCPNDCVQIAKRKQRKLFNKKHKTNRKNKAR